MLRLALALALALVPLTARGGELVVTPGGLIQADGRFFVDDAADPHTDQFAIRSLRPELDATFDHASARLVPDFAGGKIVLQDAYIDLTYTPYLAVRAGKFKVPFGLERLQPEGTPMFVERGLPTQIAPNRDLGVMLFGALLDGGVQWQLGVFDGVPDGAIGDGDDDDHKDLAARVFVVPFPCPRSPLRGLGFGVATTYGRAHGSLASPDLAAYKTTGMTTFVAYPTGATLDDTAIADGVRWRITGQGHWFYGPFGALAEYVRSQQRVALGPIATVVPAQAWQVEVQWVVTGEDATYHNVTPAAPFDPEHHTWGAFDVVARYDEFRVDGGALSDKILDPTKAARRARGYSVGVDWFLSRYLRAQLDAERTTFRLGFAGGIDRPDEDTIVGRLQASF